MIKQTQRPCYKYCIRFKFYITTKRFGIGVRQANGRFWLEQSLRMELEMEGGDLHVTTVCPVILIPVCFKRRKAPLLTALLQPEIHR